VLPYSGLFVTIPLVTIPLMTYTLAVNRVHPNGRGVIPEIGDFLSERDPQLERALTLARAQYGSLTAVATRTGR